MANGSYLERGWQKSGMGGYGVSKLGIATFFEILGRDKDVMKRGIQIYSCCPGFVRTDMTKNKAELSVE